MGCVKKYDFDRTTKYQKGKLGYSFWKKNSVFYAVTKKQFKKTFRYSITDVVPSGNYIKVKVKETYPSAYSQAYKAMDDALNYMLKHPSMSSSAVVDKYAFPRIKQRIKKYGTKKKTATVTYILKKTSKGWTIVKMSGGKTIANMGISEALDDWSDQWL